MWTQTPNPARSEYSQCAIQRRDQSLQIKRAASVQRACNVVKPHERCGGGRGGGDRGGGEVRDAKLQGAEVRDAKLQGAKCKVFKCKVLKCKVLNCNSERKQRAQAASCKQRGAASSEVLQAARCCKARSCEARCCKARSCEARSCEARCCKRGSFHHNHKGKSRQPKQSDTKHHEKS